MKLGLIIVASFVFGVSMLPNIVKAQETTSVVGMAKSNGVKRCIPTLELVANFMIEGKAHGTHAAWNKNSPDNRMYSSFTSKNYSDGNSHISVIGAVNSEGKCDGYYIETYVIDKACMIARETTFKEMEFVGTLQNTTIVLENAGGANYYLTPQAVPNICLVSKSETIYQ